MISSCPAASGGTASQQLDAARPDSTVAAPEADDSRATVIEAGARLLSTQPFLTASLADVAHASKLPIEQVKALFPTMHDLGCAILDHERASMYHAHQRALEATQDPLERLLLTVRAVGENLAGDIVVRAGVRLASESRRSFPERRIDPFRTWESFVATQLAAAEAQGVLRDEIDREQMVWLFVAVGMGVKDLLAFRGDWADAPAQLENTLAIVLSLITRPRAV